MRARLALALLLVAALSAQAQPPVPAERWIYQAIEDVYAFGILPDVDGDGVPDVVVEAYDAGAVGDHLTLLSGGATGTPSVIWSARPSSGASDGGGYGQECLVVCDDLDGDGFPDVLLGTAWGNRSVHALDGLTGNLIWTFDTYDEPESGWVYSVRAMPDRTGDGRPEVVFGTGSNGHRGYLLDGSTGAIIWRFIGATDAIGHTVVLPDLNGDGIADVLFCGWDNEHRVFAVSGAGSVAGTQLWSRNTGASNHTATVIDDITGDGIPEIVVGLWRQSNQVLCLDGSNGATVWTHDNGNYEYIMRLVVIDDVDGDGVRDVAVVSWARGLPVLSGRTGEVLWTSYAGTVNGGDFWAVASVRDIDGDGLGEVVGGSFDRHVYLFSGATGDTLWAYDTGNRLYSVAGAPDLSGNGLPDVLGGTQYLSGGGRAYLLEGGDTVTPVPDLPHAAGWAVRHPHSVALGWELSSPLPCVVDRIEGDDEGKSASTLKHDLAEAFARGHLTTREVLLAARDGGKSTAPRVTRLTAAPLGAGEPSPGGWAYTFVDDTAPAGAVRYRIAAVQPDGRELALLELSPSTSGTAPRPLVQQAQVAPNPFNPRTEVRLTLDRPATLAVDVHDALGRRVGRLGPIDGTAGHNVLRWDGTGFGGRALPTGNYVLRVTADGESRTVKASLVR